MANWRWIDRGDDTGIFWSDGNTKSCQAYALQSGYMPYAWCLITPDNRWRVELRLKSDDYWTYHDTFDTLQQAKDVAQALVLLGGAT